MESVPAGETCWFVPFGVERVELVGARVDRVQPVAHALNVVGLREVRGDGEAVACIRARGREVVDAAGARHVNPA